MIKNLLCEKCEKQLVCKWYPILIKNFDEESKKKIGIDIEVLRCKEYEEVK